MGAANSSNRSDNSLYNDDDVNFDHFQILRAIGKGSFGKVCIVQKRDSGVLYAMKYVSRSACESRGALGGVLKEVELLSSLEHPFLVNLWFSFQDEEDLFMVCDLLTGGDLRYHLQNRVEFSEESVALFVCELGSALDYLQLQRVVHRDVKPDNILLDGAGHAHLTDFNIATRLAKDALACSMSGTKPYMAPEVFMCALDEVAGYTYPVDWWSLGVVAYEMRANIRPFSVHSNTALVDVKHILSSPVHYPRYWSPDFVDLLTKLLCVHPGGRISSQQELQQTPLLRHIDFKEVLEKRTKPPFKPPEDHLNCDPCLELEEMIVETRPLHKKKKRLAKQRSAQRDSDPETALVKEFIVYNRFKELKRKDMEKKEREWERELEEAMANSVVTTLAPIMEKPSENLTVSSTLHENTPNDSMTNTNMVRQSSKKSTTMTTLSSSLQMCSNCQRSDSRKSKNTESLEFIDRSPSPNTLAGGGGGGDST
ncbi:serine/threonine-protein kinase 32A [Musca domestica]|uniref:Serine/threonine-protein kinase 32A n=1 Tax=Musca domestica TaxID=7370 RepID=A0ABM3VAE4_MUSDO|nr:serine/threonine-protein kinase 32A [Musca domestica]XP_058982744.1 serine/threonine-protein kinase 32A [Musca domestica]XP_058982745.1 serine/threonine-protein kinase 32A [Musca domestica]